MQSCIKKIYGKREVLKYHSARLNTVSQGDTGCIKYLLAIQNAFRKSEHLVQCHKLIVHTFRSCGIHAEHQTDRKYDQVVSTLNIQTSHFPVEVSTWPQTYHTSKMFITAKSDTERITNFQIPCTH